VNFINGRLEQMLKFIQDFVFVLNVVILPFPFCHAQDVLSNLH
jgi:hypothetical protein